MSKRQPVPEWARMALCNMVQPSFLQFPHHLPIFRFLNMSSSDVEAHNARLRELAPQDPYSFHFARIPSPAPGACCSISLSLIRTGYVTSGNPALILLGVDESKHQPAPMQCFLIEKQVSGQTVRLMFDLGMRNVSCRQTLELTSEGALANLDALW
jgi:hypothetical protein